MIAPVRLRSALFALVFLGVARSAVAAAGPWAEAREAKVRLVSRWAAAPSGGDAGLGLDFELEPGWHVYWKNAGDAGYAPGFELEPGPVGGARLLYPAPSRFDLPGGLVAFGYEHAVIYPLAARLSPSVANPAPIAGTLDYLVCAESCIPYRVRLELTLPIAAGEPEIDSEVATRLDAALARLPEPAPPGVAARLVAGEGEAQVLELTLPASDAKAVAPDLFFEPHPLVDLKRPVPFEPESGGSGFRVPFRPFDETKPLPDRLSFAWTATGFERAGRLLAWEGSIEAERSAPSARPVLIVTAATALAALAAVGFALQRRSRTAAARST